MYGGLGLNCTRCGQRDGRPPGSGRRGSVLVCGGASWRAARERERERARPSPQQTRARAGGERGARGNCGDGHDVEGREKQEDERKRKKRRLDLFWGTISLRSTFRHAVERCGPGERGPCAKAASARETSGCSEGTRVLNGQHSPLPCKRRALALAPGFARRLGRRRRNCYYYYYVVE